MRLYRAKVDQYVGKRNKLRRKRQFMVRADSADDAWKAVEGFLNDEPFNREDLKPFEVREVASVNAMVYEISG